VTGTNSIEKYVVKFVEREICPYVDMRTFCSGDALNIAKEIIALYEELKLIEMDQSTDSNKQEKRENNT